MIAYLLINLEAGREKEVHDALNKVPSITELYPLFGEYDLICKIEGPDLESVGTTIAHNVRRVSGVLATKTLAGAKF